MKLLRFERVLRNFQNKYLLALLVSALVPLLVTLVLVLYITKTNFETMKIRGAVDETRVVSQHLVSRVEQLRLVSENLSNYVQSQTNASRSDSGLDDNVQSYSELTRYENLRNNILNMETLYNVQRIRVFSDRLPYLRGTNHLNFYNMDSFDALASEHPQLLGKVSLNRLNYILVKHDSFFWHNRFLVNVDTVSFYRSVYNSNRELIAVVLVECLNDSFLDNADRLTSGTIAISNAAGDVICASGDVEGFLDVQIDGQTGYALKNGNLVARYDVPSIDWKLTVAVPLDLNINVWQTLGSAYAFILLATFVLAVGMGVLLSRLQARRLENYYNAVKSLDVSVPQSGENLPDKLDLTLASIKNPDEVDQIMSSFSTLIRDNFNLLNGMKQHDLEIEKYKFKVLQEQINPHFLYNALETLRICMIMDRKQDAIKSLDSLSRFYRIALSKGRDTISVKEELDMISNYLEIENIGYGNSLHWNMDVDERCLDLPIPKFLLQPLVENSIIHSKIAGDQSSLEIDISVQLRDNTLEMIIQDNGSGIDPADLADIRRGLLDNSLKRNKNGFGLSNVNRRLKLFYGAEYGLDLRSEPGYTKNIICLPLDILW